MSHKVLSSTLAFALGLANGQAAVGTGQVAKAPPEVQVHIDAARIAAGDDFKSLRGQCDSALQQSPSASGARPGPCAAGPEIGPVKVFDNLYFVGMASVSAWAVKTSDGIILIDALNNGREAETYIVGGLRKLGLDPSQIKYLVITHSHGDHYGGAQYLVDKFHPHVAMSDADWKGVEGPLQFDNPNWDAPPKRDLTLSDSQKITLGDQTVTIYVTPGHTLGTVSLLIPVTDQGRPHVVALWGGTAFNFKPEVERFKTYAASAERFASVARTAGADVPLSNHAFVDGTIEKVARLQQRQANDPHPFVMGVSAETRFLTTLAECAMANAAALQR